MIRLLNQQYANCPRSTLTLLAMRFVRMSSHGGKRKGAGRPPALNRKVTMTFRVDPEIAKWLRAHPASQAELIESALRKTYDIGQQ